MRRINVPNAELFAEVRRLLAEGRQVSILARGDSMVPFIRGGIDKVVLCAPDSNPSENDILLCEIAPGKFVLHRLTGIDGDCLQLTGDGNARGTEKCRKDNVVAKAVRVIRPDGTEVDCCSPSERRKARLWRRLRPVRRLLLAVWRRTAGRRRDLFAKDCGSD